MGDIQLGIDPYTSPSFSLGNRARRALWGIVYTLLFKFTPRPMYRWRAAILRLFGAKVGRMCNVHPSVRIWGPWNLYMADYSAMAEDVVCYCMGRITLGERAVVSQGAHLCAGTHDYADPHFQLQTRPIAIGARAWVCAGAFVGPGVSVGEGAVIGARAVATKDVPPWTVCVGNPLVVLKERKLRGGCEPNHASECAGKG